VNNLRVHEEAADAARTTGIETGVHQDRMAELRAFVEQRPVGGQFCTWGRPVRTSRTIGYTP